MKHYCREASRLLSDSCERKLTVLERIRLRFHIMICSFCRDHEHNARILEEILNRIQQSDADTGARLSESDCNRIREALRKVQESGKI